MNAVEVKGLKFAYHGAKQVAISVPELTVERGETILIVGRSGEGKSTLVNCLNGVIPHIFSGLEQGSVTVEGIDVIKASLPKLCGVIGTLLQDPETQVLNYTVEEEVSFGPENLCLSEHEIADRVSEAIEETGIAELKDRETYTLSGGELQRVALAACLSLRPKVIILDEPTSNIDPEGTAMIFQTLNRLREGRTLLIVEHKLERVLPFVDRVILVREGKIAFDVKKQELMEHIDDLREAGVETPETYVYAKLLGLRTVDLEVVKGRLAQSSIELPVYKRAPAGPPVMTVHAKVSYQQKVLLDAGFTLEKGHTLAIMGRNGAGKSTMLKAIMGFLDKDLHSEGHLEVEGTDLSKASIQERGRYIALLPQNFDLTLISKSVEDEISYSLRKRGVRNYKPMVEEYLKMFSLDKVRDSDPALLSLGQRRRVAMAAILSGGAKIMMLDEPTSGQDFANKESLAGELEQLKQKGHTFIVVTHDSKFVYRHADRVVVLNNGEKVLDGTPEKVFENSAQYSIIPPAEYELSQYAIQKRVVRKGA